MTARPARGISAPEDDAGELSSRVRRRVLLLGGVGAACRPARLSASDADAAKFSPPAPNDLLVPEGGEALRQPIAPHDVRAGAPPLRAWPMQPEPRIIRNGDRFNQILLVRPAGDAILAFSAICTHASCAVSAWDGVSHLLICPCHGSAFDAQRGGAVARGPAARALPNIRIRIAGGVLTLASTFIGRVGGDTNRTM